MKIGVFGGSFNPPHMMHKMLVTTLLNRNIVEKIIVIPTGTSYPKPGLICAHHRVHMLKLMFQNRKDVIVSEYERKSSLTYTYQTLAHIQEKYPNDTIYFICGSDNLREFYWWKKHEDMLENYHFIIIPRNGDRIEELEKLYPEYKKHIHFSNLSLLDMSSTLIRNKIKENKDHEIMDNLDSKVYAYIKEKQFYKK